MVGSLPDVIMYAKFQVKIFRGYDFTGGRISHFPIDFWMGLTTVQRDCAACDKSKSYNNFTFTFSNCLYCCVFYVLLLFVQCWPRLGVSTFCRDWLIDFILGHVSVHCHFRRRHCCVDRPVWMVHEDHWSLPVTAILLRRMQDNALDINAMSDLFQLFGSALHYWKIYLSALSTEARHHLHQASHQYRHRQHRCRRRSRNSLWTLL